MNLELSIINIKNIQFADNTSVSDGVLYINVEELQELLQQDTRFSRVDIELVHPGERSRVVRCFDVIEPRCKLGSGGENFPGALGKLKIAGEGRSRVLRGAAVVTVDYTGLKGMILEMSGPSSELGLYGKLQNIILLPSPAEGIQGSDYQNALKMAGLKAAVYLAEATKNLKADEVEVYNLGSLTEAGKGLEHLPRIAYVYQVQALQHYVDRPKNDSIYYGDNASKLLPTIVHPNEILDGAITKGYVCMGQDTYTIQNHPVVRELYRRHGKDLCFAGVVITVAQDKEQEREKMAVLASRLVKWVLGADGVVLTKIGGGAPHVDLGLTCERCEELGVKTAMIVTDISSDASSEGALIINTPRADATVSAGPFMRSITLPPVERVIGSPLLSSDTKQAEEEFTINISYINGAISQIGASKEMVREI